MQNTTFTDAAWRDYLCWQGESSQALARINDLIEAARRTPNEGIGKPEPLKGGLSGLWSRRIDSANRLVYAVGEGAITVISCRYHY